MIQMTHYDTLQCDRKATSDELKFNYHRLIRLTHPDKGGTDRDFCRVWTAWRILSCNISRKEYDASLMQSHVPLHADVNCSEMNLDLMTGVFLMTCRCGGQYMVESDDLQSYETLAPCDSCSFYIRVRKTPCRTARKLFCSSFKRIADIKSSRSLPKLVTGLSAITACRLLSEARCETVTYRRLDGKLLHDLGPSFDWVAFWKLLKPFLKELIAAIIAALACAALSIHIPRVLGDIINVVSSHLKSSADSFLKDIKGPAFRLVALYALLAISTFLYIHFLTTVGEGVAQTMKTNLFRNILRQDIAFFDAHRTGDLINRLTVDVNDFKSAFKMIISQGLRNTAQALGCTVTLLSISPQMTGLMIVAVPSIILIGTILGAILRKMSFDAKAQNSRLTLLADEALGNIRTVRAFAMEELEADMFDQHASRARVLNELLGMGIAAFQAGTSLFLNGMVLSTLYVGGHLLSEQRISPGDLMAYLVALQMLQRSFTQLSLLFGTYIKGLHAGARVFEVLNVEPSVDIKTGRTIPYHSLMPDIELVGVTFAYPGRPGRNVLKDFSLKIPVGKTVALVGSSGSGKSTIASLLERLYDVDSGKILLGGQDIRELNPTWLRGRVLGLISQEPVLFATTVLENIRYGRPDASDLEVIEAAKMANADEFIRRFPEGYNTMVGERGVAVSGGQKQRIAIARALLKNPSVLILDEATSALDTESEHLVQSALDKVMANRTTVVIAHRLSTIQNADLIVVINDGVIVEVGTHLELMSRKGMYATFVQQQKLSGKS